MILWNDVISWDKEHEAFNRGQAGFLSSAMTIMMRLHGINAATSKGLLWEETVKTEEQYCEARDRYLKEKSPGPHIRRWFGLVEIATAGNALRHTTSARYNKRVPIPIRSTNGDKLNIKGQASSRIEVGSTRQNANASVDPRPKLRGKRKLNGEKHNGEQGKVRNQNV